MTRPPVCLSGVSQAPLVRIVAACPDVPEFSSRPSTMGEHGLGWHAGSMAFHFSTQARLICKTPMDAQIVDACPMPACPRARPYRAAAPTPTYGVVPSSLA